MSNHAILSASGATRWMECPASVGASVGIEDKTSCYAAEGTIAHELLEKALLSWKNGTQLTYPEGVTEEMKQHCFNTAQTIIAQYQIYNCSFLHLESKVDYSDYVPEGFGTCDVIMGNENQAFIIDFKYGAGVTVSAENNPQLKLYALGAIQSQLLPITCNNIRMVIIQPRVSDRVKPISFYDMTYSDLIGWGVNIVAPKAQLAWSIYRGEIDIKGDLQHYKQGDHCRWCKALLGCRLKRQEVSDGFNMIGVEVGQPLDKKTCKAGMANVSNAFLSDFLTKMHALDFMLSAVQDEALKRTLKGEEIQGFKVVLSNPRVKWGKDALKQIEKLKLDIPIQDLTKTELKTITEVRKMMGADVFELKVADVATEKPDGKPTLVPVSDKRPVFVAAEQVQKDFTSETLPPQPHVKQQMEQKLVENVVFSEANRQESF